MTTVMNSGVAIILGWQIGLGMVLSAEVPSHGVEASNPAPARLEADLHSPPPSTRRPRTLQAARAARAAQVAEATRRLVINGKDSSGETAKYRVPYDPLGAYERELLSLIRARWMRLTAQQRTPLKIGQVKLTFTLSSDGRVSDIKADAGELGANAGLLCVQALSDTAPFEHWTARMIEQLGRSQCHTSVIFHFGESMPAHMSDGMERNQWRLAAHIWDDWATRIERAAVASRSRDNSLTRREYVGAYVPDTSFPIPYYPGGSFGASHAASIPSGYSSRPALSSTMPTRQFTVDKGLGGGVKPLK